jgi:hypothetical protein
LTEKITKIGHGICFVNPSTHWNGLITVCGPFSAREQNFMQLPSNFPNPQRNAQAIQGLLERVRRLDQDAKARLNSMLDEELDLPYLDVMEREYAKTFRRIAPEHANLLRSRFVRALNDQRSYLIDLVRNVLQENGGNTLQSEPELEAENIF